MKNEWNQLDKTCCHVLATCSFRKHTLHQDKTNCDEFLLYVDKTVTDKLLTFSFMFYEAYLNKIKTAEKRICTVLNQGKSIISMVAVLPFCGVYAHEMIQIH